MQSPMIDLSNLISRQRLSIHLHLIKQSIKKITRTRTSHRLRIRSNLCFISTSTKRLKIFPRCRRTPDPIHIQVNILRGPIPHRSHMMPGVIIDNRSRRKSTISRLFYIELIIIHPKVIPPISSNRRVPTRQKDSMISRCSLHPHRHRSTQLRRTGRISVQSLIIPNPQKPSRSIKFIRSGSYLLFIGYQASPSNRCCIIIIGIIITVVIKWQIHQQILIQHHIRRRQRLTPPIRCSIPVIHI